MRRARGPTFSQRIFRLREATGMSWEQAQRTLVRRSADARRWRARAKAARPSGPRWWED